jgi:hypothetical protein
MAAVRRSVRLLTVVALLIVGTAGLIGAIRNPPDE